MIMNGQGREESFHFLQNSKKNIRKKAMRKCHLISTVLNNQRMIMGVNKILVLGPKISSVSFIP